MKSILLLLLPFVNGFFSHNYKITRMSINAAVNINPLKYSNEIGRKPISDLIKDIDNKNVNDLFFTNDMKTLYSRQDFDTDGIYEIEDYSITAVDPSVSSMIFEHSTKQNIKTTILEPPIDLVSSFINGFYGAFNIFFVCSCIFIMPF